MNKNPCIIILNEVKKQRIKHISYEYKVQPQNYTIIPLLVDLGQLIM